MTVDTPQRALFPGQPTEKKTKTESQANQEAEKVHSEGSTEIDPDSLQ